MMVVVGGGDRGFPVGGDVSRSAIGEFVVF